MKIDRIETTLYQVPLPTPIQAASTAVMHAFDLVMVRVADSDGATGCGYTVMHAGQGAGAAVLVEKNFTPLTLGEDPRCIERIWANLWRTHHYVGRGGLVSFALAALDTALWDLRGRTLGEPLWRLLGGYSPKVRAYAGNIDLNFPVPELLDGASRSLAAGFKSIKMRLGKPTLREDVARVEAMRSHLGADIELMSDANEAWRPDQAIRAFRALQPYDLVWIEEPLRPDDYAGYAHLRANGGIPIAAGENLHTLAEFNNLMTAGGVDFPEPDLTTCGGITVWMKIAHLAQAHGLPVTSHGAHEVHVHLLAAAPNASYLEVHGFGLEQYMAQRLTIDEGYAIAPDRPGHGIEFDFDALAVHQQ
ncbi:MAG: uroporphyrinogen decarboxylase [Gammaproteobacteria bacterium]|nr:uroporphyrinogen decarboxylase [Gammaproteobacteria bacterium]